MNIKILFTNILSFAVYGLIFMMVSCYQVSSTGQTGVEVKEVAIGTEAKKSYRSDYYLYTLQTMEEFEKISTLCTDKEQRTEVNEKILSDEDIDEDYAEWRVEFKDESGKYLSHLDAYKKCIFASAAPQALFACALIVGCVYEFKENQLEEVDPKKLREKLRNQCLKEGEEYKEKHTDEYGNYNNQAQGAELKFYQGNPESICYRMIDEEPPKR
ncbi:MAG: hypothetical protein OXC40_05480 [Proteobacteria bacterium]|nr:hypothetical protein [Pseudomonadota bacterium]